MENFNVRAVPRACLSRATGESTLVLVQAVDVGGSGRAAATRCSTRTSTPAWRAWLSRPAGRVLFAGEHTSVRWQGYMNGAIESFRRAAAESGLPSASHDAEGDVVRISGMSARSPHVSGSCATSVAK